MSHRHPGPHPRRPLIQLNPNTVNFFIKVVRDLAIFVLGSYGFIHELTRSGSERPQILIMSAAMMGLPLIIRGDEKRQEGRSSETKQQSVDPPSAS